MGILPLGLLFPNSYFFSIFEGFPFAVSIDFAVYKRQGGLELDLQVEHLFPISLQLPLLFGLSVLLLHMSSAH